jgi:hypothetical protein
LRLLKSPLASGRRISMDDHSCRISTPHRDGL